MLRKARIDAPGVLRHIIAGELGFLRLRYAFR